MEMVPYWFYLAGVFCGYGNGGVVDVGADTLAGTFAVEACSSCPQWMEWWLDAMLCLCKVLQHY